MHTTRIMRWTATAATGAALALTPLALAGAASAAPMPAPPGVVAHTHISNTGDSGGSSGVWAVDAYNRDLKITEVSGPVAGVYTYSATVDDNGTFQTIKNAGDPNSTGHELHVVSGKLTGHDTFSFTANALPSSASNHGVPASVRRTGAYETNNPIVPGPATGVSSLTTDDAGTSYWYSLAFPSGTTFGGTGIQTFSYTYKTGCETYTNAATSTGDITGKICHVTPPVHPAPPAHTLPPHGHRAPHYTVLTQGHIQSQQSHKFVTDVDGRLVQLGFLSNSGQNFALVENHAGQTGLETETSFGHPSGYFVLIPDTGQAITVHHFVVTSKHGAYYYNTQASSPTGHVLNNSGYSLNDFNHQIGWVFGSGFANEHYSTPGE